MNENNKSAYNAEAISTRIATAAQTHLDLPADVAQDVAFHMTDWLADLANFQQFCLAPNSLSDAELGDLLLAFLVHVPNHIAAAAKLYTGTGVKDIFGIGAVENEE